MNTKLSPSFSENFFRNLKVSGVTVGVAACLGISLWSSTAQAESFDVLHGLTPMDSAELESAYGGFVLPNGMNINIGIETGISIDGKLIVQNHYSSGKIEPQTNSAVNAATSAKIEKLGTTTQIYKLATAALNPNPQPEPTSLSGNTAVVNDINPLTGATATLIYNTANQVVISQVQKITIDVANYAATNLMAYRALATLRAQALNGLRNVLR